MAAQTGRPSKLDASMSASVAARLIRGDSISATARDVGISRRTLTSWLRAAWSSNPRDAEAVRLVQTIMRGRGAAAQRRVALTDRNPAIGPGHVEDSPLRELDELLREIK